MKSTFLITTLLFLVSCVQNGMEGGSGPDSEIMGLNEKSTAIDFTDVDPGLACANGGISIFTFYDDNKDGVFQGEESVIKVKAICHGQNGANGVDGDDGVSASVTLESVSSSLSCPNGGVKIFSNSSSSVEVCNGVNGINGEQGIPGVQGIPGIAGAPGANGSDGTTVTPVMFCPDGIKSASSYGLIIEGELFAIFWGKTATTPKKDQAYLTKLEINNYQNSGAGCLLGLP